MTKHKVAILIPTMNRSDFLIRQLQYYASVNSPHPVYIGDASDDEHKEQLEMTIEQLQHLITIHYHHWPGHNDRQALARLIELTEESYCAFAGDDDFLIPNSLTKCARLLKQNQEYRTAQGKGPVFTLDEPGPYGEMKGLGAYWLKNEIEENTGKQRLLKFFPQSYFVNQFSVHRKEEFLQDSEFYQIIDDSSFAELLHTSLAVIKGKSKFIDSLYLIRHVHPEQHTGSYLNWKNDFFDWLTHPDWQPSFQVFNDTLIRALCEVDGIEENEASEIVKQAFWSYLAGGMWRKYQSKYGQTTSSKQNAIVNGKVNSWKSLRELVKKIPGAREVVNQLRNVKASIVPGHEDLMTKEDRLVMRAEKGELSLPVLLHPSSPYHEDFLPVYEAITGQPVKL